jgi:hypothetical protein
MSADRTRPVIQELGYIGVDMNACGFSLELVFRPKMEGANSDPNPWLRG